MRSKPMMEPKLGRSTGGTWTSWGVAKVKELAILPEG
jgi:hypothetical protein